MSYMFNLIKILETEYTVNFVNVLKQSWQEKEVWSCIGKPKEYHLFLLIEGGKVEYLLKLLKNSKTQKYRYMLYVPSKFETEV